MRASDVEVIPIYFLLLRASEPFSAACPVETGIGFFRMDMRDMGFKVFNIYFDR